jgi:hypothetical protein
MTINTKHDVKETVMVRCEDGLVHKVKIANLQAEVTSARSHVWYRGDVKFKGVKSPIWFDDGDIVGDQQ